MLRRVLFAAALLIAVNPALLATPEEDLILALNAGNIEEVKYALTRGASPRTTYAYGIPVVCIPAGRGDLAIVKLLVEKGAVLQGDSFVGYNSPLLEAAIGGHCEMVEYLIARGVPLEVYDPNGRTPLMLAALRGRTATVKLLIEKGAKINVRDVYGATSLRLARANGHREAVAVLEAAGAKE